MMNKYEEAETAQRRRITDIDSDIDIAMSLVLMAQKELTAGRGDQFDDLLKVARIGGDNRRKLLVLVEEPEERERLWRTGMAWPLNTWTASMPR